MKVSLALRKQYFSTWILEKREIKLLRVLG